METEGGIELLQIKLGDDKKGYTSFFGCMTCGRYHLIPKLAAYCSHVGEIELLLVTQGDRALAIEQKSYDMAIEFEKMAVAKFAKELAEVGR